MWTVLGRLSKERARRLVKQFNDNAFESCIGDWIDTDAVEVLPEDVKETVIEPIIIIVHNRVFIESSIGYIDREGRAYISEENWERLF